MQRFIASCGAAAALALTCLAAACTSTQTSTSVTAPTDSRCQISVQNSASSFSSNGGSGTINVTTTRDCTWSAGTDSSWVSFSGTPSGQGSGSVAYTIAANPAPVSRTGALVVASERVEVTQAAAPCRYALTRAGDSIDSTGGRLSFDVTTLSGCGWTATTGDGWIAIASGQSGNATGT